MIKTKFLKTILLLSVLGVSLIPPASAAYGFNTTEPWAPILQNNVRFTSGYSRSWIELDINVVRSDGSWIKYSITEVISDYSRYFNVYIDGVRKSSVVHGSSFTSSLISLGILSAGQHTIKIEIYNGIYGGNWELTEVKLNGGNYALTNVRNVAQSQFFPEDANEEMSASAAAHFWDICNIDIYNSIDTQGIAPPHLIYGSSGLNNFMINSVIDSRSTNYDCGYRLYTKSVKITLQVRMIDNDGGDLGMLSMSNSDVKDAISGVINYNSLNWRLGASYGGVSGSVGLSRGNAFYRSSIDTRPSNSGANGAWRRLAIVNYNINTGQNVRIATDFSLSATSLDMSNLLGHNIQFNLIIQPVMGIYYTLFKLWDGSFNGPTFSYILGDGIGQSTTPNTHADTWIVALDGGSITTA